MCLFINIVKNILNCIVIENLSVKDSFIILIYQEVRKFLFKIPSLHTKNRFSSMKERKNILYGLKFSLNKRCLVIDQIVTCYISMYLVRFTFLKINVFKICIAI